MSKPVIFSQALKDTVREYRICLTRANEPGITDDETDTWATKAQEIEERVYAIPCQNSTDLHYKALMIKVDMEESDCSISYSNEPLLDSIIEDILRLFGPDATEPAFPKPSQSETR